MGLSAPEPLADHHDISRFSSGVPSLDDWLKRRALANQAGGASRSYVVTDNTRVVAYYALASGSIEGTLTQGRFRRNMPNPIPVALLGRLAIDREFQGLGLGRDLFRDCALRVMHAAGILGIRGIVVHAISAEAKAFYHAIGFDASPQEPMTLMVSLSDLRALCDPSAD